MNVLSLFDGISCGMVAIERAGIQVDTYYASEIDKNAIAISQKNHNGIVQLGDITKWREWDIPWNDIDLIIAGSPCQGFSRAGKCLNFNDPRSRLFFVFVDILNAVRQVNPGVKFLLENVKMKNEWRDVISEHIGVQPIEINSKCMSAQNRPRIYWTNIELHAVPDWQGTNLLDILEDGIDTTGFIEHAGLLFDPSISEQSRNLVYRVGKEVRVKQSVKQGYIVAKNGDGINLSFPCSKSRRGRVINQKSSTLDCACNICVLQNNVIRRFTIRELERLQTLPDGYTDGFPASVAQQVIGNGWTVDVIAFILKHIGIKRKMREDKTIMKIMLDKGAKMPTRAHEWDAGLDLYAMEDVRIPAAKAWPFFDYDTGLFMPTPVGSATIDTGVHVEIPEGCVGFIKSKSGLMCNHGIVTDGTIDAHYTGSIRVCLFNNGSSKYEVKAGDKIAQLVIVPCLLPELELVDSLDETDRGDNGFGSTGYR